MLTSGFFGADSIRPFDKANVEKDLKAKKFKTKDLERAVLEALDPNWVEQDDDDGNDGDEGKPTLEKRKPKVNDSRSARKAGAQKKTNVAKTAAAGEDNKDTLNHSKRGVNEDDKAGKKKRASVFGRMRRR